MLTNRSENKEDKMELDIYVVDA
ncbi:hypothetical protein D046_1717A, partial [Vibrio parahaemolyticus V-223/04]